MPDVRIQPVDTRGSLGNIEALQDGTVDVGLAQAGIAYMAYNGRLRESGRAMRGLRGIAILNSSAVHLLVGPGSSIRSMDELRGRRVGIGPDGSGAAVISQVVLHGYFSPGDVHEVDATVPQTNEMLLDNALDAAFTISSVPNDDARHLTEAGARLLPIRGPASIGCAPCILSSAPRSFRPARTADRMSRYIRSPSMSSCSRARVSMTLSCAG